MYHGYYVLEIQVEDPELLNVYEEQINKHNTMVLSNQFPDSGFDLFIPEKITIEGRSTRIVKLNIKAAMYYVCNSDKESKGVAYYIYPRSSMGTKTPLRLANSVGIIDSGYRGTLGAILDNSDGDSYTIESNTRLVQICHASLEPFYVRLASNLEVTNRGEGGFGSTGSEGIKN
jgi:dUTP pyrophosphatase